MGLLQGTVIGLDIGSSAVKMAQFVEKAGGLRLVRTGLKELPHCNSDTVGADEAVAVAVRALCKGVAVRRAKIVASISCEQTAVKKAVTPCMPRAELREGIRLHSKEYFPFSLDRSVLDFEILGEVIEKGVKKFDIMVGASPLQTTFRYRSILEKAGIGPVSLIPVSAALQKLAASSSLPKEETRCLVDIGERFTALVICRGGRLMFARKIPVAATDFTKALTGTLLSDKGRMQLSMEEAEALKKKIGIPSAGASEAVSDKISAIQVSSMLRAPLEQLISELERCFYYYREEAGGRIDSLVLFGGGAALGGLDTALFEALGIETKIGDPFEGLAALAEALPGPADLRCRFATAIGAALSVGKGLNLLPPEAREKKRALLAARTLKAAGVSAALILVALFFGMRAQLDNFKRQITVAMQELSALEPEYRKAEALIVANKVLINEPQWEDVLVELSNLLPDTVNLTSLSMRNGSITMRGVIASPDAEEILSNFILTLEKGIFDGVKLVRSKEAEIRNNRGTEFELKCWIDYES